MESECTYVSSSEDDSSVVNFHAEFFSISVNKDDAI